MSLPSSESKRQEAGGSKQRLCHTVLHPERHNSFQQPLWESHTQHSQVHMLDDLHIPLLYSTTLDLNKSSNQKHGIYGRCFKTFYSIKLQNSTLCSCRFHLWSVVPNIEHYLLLSPGVSKLRPAGQHRPASTTYPENVFFTQISSAESATDISLAG
jgi:hypothetical protein